MWYVGKLGGKRASATTALLSALVCLGFGDLYFLARGHAVDLWDLASFGGSDPPLRYLSVPSLVVDWRLLALELAAKILVSLVPLRNAFEHLFPDLVHLTSFFGCHRRERLSRAGRFWGQIRGSSSYVGTPLLLRL